MLQPLVSIIIPTFNRAHLIGETLDSVLAQTYTNWECIIVDDGSTDTTDEVVDGYVARDVRFQYHHRPSDRPKGANACRNYGFEVSKGEYVNWFDDDDVMLEEFLMIKSQNFNKEVEIVICSGYYTDENLKNLKCIELNENLNLFRDYVIWNQQILTPSVLFKTEFLVNKNLFDISIERGQEAEFFSRLFFNISKGAYRVINIPLFLYRQHTNTKSFSNKIYNNRFKKSESYIFIDNIKRAGNLKDIELMNILFKRLINLFFLALTNKDFRLTKYIYLNCLPLIYKFNKRFFYEFLIFGKLMLINKRSIYLLNKRWLNKNVFPIK